MKENKDKNEQFIARHQTLKAEGKDATEIATTICQEFGISNHSYRAWKSRLKLSYGATFDQNGVMTAPGRYTSQIVEFMVAPSQTKTVPSVQVINEATTTEIATHEPETATTVSIQ